MVVLLRAYLRLPVLMEAFGPGAAQVPPGAEALMAAADSAGAGAGVGGAAGGPAGQLPTQAGALLPHQTLPAELRKSVSDAESSLMVELKKLVDTTPVGRGWEARQGCRTLCSASRQAHCNATAAVLPSTCSFTTSPANNHAERTCVVTCYLVFSHGISGYAPLLWDHV